MCLDVCLQCAKSSACSSASGPTLLAIYHRSRTGPNISHVALGREKALAGFALSQLEARGRTRGQARYQRAPLLATVISIPRLDLPGKPAAVCTSKSAYLEAASTPGLVLQFQRVSRRELDYT